MNRRLPLILVAGVLVLCLVGVVIAGVSAGSGFGAVAYTVGGTKVSQQSVNDDIKALVDQKNFADTYLGGGLQTTPGAVNSNATAQWLTLEISREVGAQALAAKGKTISEAARKKAFDAAVSQQGPSFATALKRLPDGMRRRLLDVIAMNLKASMFKGVHITVDPKYGFWNPTRLAVCPPTGCPAANSTTGG